MISIHKVKKVYFIIITFILLLSTGCELRLKQYGDDSETVVNIQRYDRLESRYLTTGDFSALQQMNIDYPMETRTLVEDVLQLGEVNDPEINTKFLQFYQDTTLQVIISEAELQYANVCDISKQFSLVFAKMRKMFPEMQTPTVYMQIGALDQSVVIGNNSIGISLDKYLGADFPIYRRYYTAAQRKQMTREAIVPDCICFWLLSMYPLHNYDACTQNERDMHMGKIMWVVNKLLGKKVFHTKFTVAVEKYVDSHSMSMKDLLLSENF